MDSQRAAEPAAQTIQIRKEPSMSAYSAKTTARKTTRFRPEIQALEDRQVLSASATFSAGVLTLRGDSKADFVSVTHDGTGHVTGSISGISFNRVGVNKLVIDTQGGRDTVRFTQTG